MNNKQRLLKRMAEDNTQVAQSGIYGADGHVKDEIITTIIEEMNWDGDSEATDEVKSNDWYTPNDPGQVYINVDGTASLEKITNEYGQLSSQDLMNLKAALEDSDDFKDEIESIMKEFKDSMITDFTVNKIEVSITNTEVKVSADATDFAFRESDGFDD